MQYKTLEIKNFKGIKEVEIDFSYNRILTLVGLNESGKTTILEAINLFYSLLRSKELSPQELKDIRPKGIDFTGSIILSGTLEFEDSDYKLLDDFVNKREDAIKIDYPKEFSFEYSFKYEVHSYMNTETTSGFTAKAKTLKSKSTKGKNKKVVKTPRAKSLHTTHNALWNALVVFLRTSVVPEILYFEDFIFEIPEKISFEIPASPGNAIETAITLPPTPETSAQDKEWKLVFNDILNTLGSKFTTFQDNIVNIWKSDNDTARQRLAAMEKQLDKKITNAWKELFGDKEKRENQRLNFKEIKLVPISDSTDKVSFSFKVKTESGKEFSLNERSKGCKWFFSFLIFTEFRKNRTKNILFLLDEPASNLHSSAQLKILNAIESLSDKSVIVYSTHSHHLINPIWLNGAYVVINEGMSVSNLEGALTDNDTKITIDKYYNYVSERTQDFQTLYFQPILDRLDYKPSFIDPVPSMGICEGKYDWYTFKYVNEIVLQNKYKFNLFPGKGADSNADTMRLYLAWGTVFLLILDGDKGGRDAKKKYIADIGKIIEDRIFTYEDILEEKICTEEIFTIDDQINLCDEAFGSGTFSKQLGDKKKIKSTLNFAISQLLTSKKNVSLEVKTIEKFDKLFGFIESKI